MEACRDHRTKSSGDAREKQVCIYTDRQTDGQTRRTDRHTHKDRQKNDALVSDVLLCVASTKWTTEDGRDGKHLRWGLFPTRYLVQNITKSTYLVDRNDILRIFSVVCIRTYIGCKLTRLIRLVGKLPRFRRRVPTRLHKFQTPCIYAITWYNSYLVLGIIYVTYQ